MKKFYQTTRRLFLTLLIVCSATFTWAQSNIGAITWNATNQCYEIASEAALEDLAVYVNGSGTYSTGGDETTPHDCAGLTFKMIDNITMENEHTPIGRYVETWTIYSFNGTFDGNTNSITNLTIDQPDGEYLGLFCYLGNGATVKDLTLNNCDITGKTYVGGIAGFANGDYNSKVNIQNCHVNGTIQATVEGAFGLGGIVGCPDDTNITGCTVTGSVSASNTGSANRLGGIVGSQFCSCTITYCENAATISGSGSYHGGIVGAFGCTPFSYSNCLNTGFVEGTSNIGAIMGDYQTYLAEDEYFIDCYYVPANNNNITAFGVDNQGNETEDAPGHAERAYTINKGNYISTITSETASFTSTINGTKYYKNGDYTLTLTPNVPSGYSFIGYSCEGGTLTNLASETGTHTLTVYNSNVTINALLSNNNGTSIVDADIDEIPNKRWKGGSPIEPTVSVTLYGTQLTEGTDYFVNYTNNTAIGTATATVSGINGYTGSVSADFEILNFPGEGTEASPYEIANEEDLQALACIVNNGAENYIQKYLKQTLPITLTQEHTPIGKDYNHPFKGNYNGDNKTISGLRINKPETRYQGLFGYTDGQNFDGIYYKANIMYVVIENCDITGGIYTGGVVGYINEGTVKNCKVSGAIKMAEGKELYCYGGVAGSSNYGNIEDCINTASVTAYSSCGGIVGDNNNGGKVKNCFNAGIVTGTDSYVGSIAGSNYGHLTNNYHTTATTGGVGVWNATTGTDTEGAGIAATITLGTDVSFAEQPTAFAEVNNVKYFISGTEVKLNYVVPTNKFFDRYTVNSGVISNAGIIDGVHTLTGFNTDLTINGSSVDNRTSLADIGAVISAIDPLTYNAQVQHPVPEVTLGGVPLIEGNDYTVSYSEGCTNVGEHTVIATGIGRYAESVSETFNITPFNISGEGAITVSGVYDEYAKTGSAINPVPTVVCAATNNATLVDGTDYDVIYNGGCTAPGDYSLTITAKGNYTGSKSVPFTILDVSELTVYDGTNGQLYMPVSGSDATYYQKCEFVMPKSGLEDMTNKAITSMRFYLQTKASGSWGNARWRVFMKEVNFTQFTGDNSAFSGTNDATIVYEGALDGTNDVMTVTFDTPYVYNGGNLLIGFYQYQKGTSNYSYFYVKMAQSSACVQGTSSSSLNNVGVSRSISYLPKTTFRYNDAATLEVAGYGESTTAGWVFISSPLISETDPTEVSNMILTGDDVANYDLYRLNPSTTVWENYKKEHTEAFVIENGKGYLYANKNDVTLAFIGTLNTATSQEVGLDEGWNLVGNPLNGPAYVNKPFYKLNEAGGEQAAGSIIVPVVENFDNYVATTIPACTGIIVQAANSGEKVTFSTDAPDVATGNSGNLDITLKQANTRGNAMLDKAIVSFNESKLGKFYFGEQNANVYIPQDNEEYAIVSAQGQGEMPLNFKANKNGEFTLSVNPEGVDMDYLHLIDNMTGSDIDLLVTPSYSFNAMTTDYASRFKLVFNANNVDDNDNFAFISNGQLIVTGEGTLQVFDVLGHQLFAKQVSLTTNLSTLTTPGVYVLRLVNGNETKTQKIVIK